MGYCFKGLMPVKVDAYEEHHECFKPHLDKPFRFPVQCRRCAHFKRNWEQTTPGQHISNSVVKRCAKSSTIYSCSIRHSYENDPIFSLSRDGWKMRSWDRGFESKYIIREFVNVEQGIQIDTLLDYRDWYDKYRGEDELLRLTGSHSDLHSKMELTQNIYIGNKVIEIHVSLRNWEGKCCDVCENYGTCSAYQHDQPCDKLKKEREEQQISPFEKELLEEALNDANTTG